MNNLIAVSPEWYTTHEGGHKYPWVFGSIDAKELDQRDKTHVYLDGNQVHSLGIDGQRWDCINGWNKSE